LNVSYAITQQELSVLLAIGAVDFSVHLMATVRIAEAARSDHEDFTIRKHFNFWKSGCQSEQPCLS
jgi:hypothetical protein